MGIRINKVLTEFNIGLQTLIDFLKEKRGELGDIRDDVSVNTKLTDEQYNAVLKRFGKKRRCAKCGYENMPEYSYCVKCGELLKGSKEIKLIAKSTYDSIQGNIKSLENRVRVLTNTDDLRIEQIQSLQQKLDRLENDKVSDKRQEKRITELEYENKQLLERIRVQNKTIDELRTKPSATSIPQKQYYDVVLKSAGEAKLQVVKAVKEYLNIGLKEAKDYVDGAPSILKKYVPKYEAEAIKSYIEKAGATIVLT